WTLSPGPSCPYVLQATLSGVVRPILHRPWGTRTSVARPPQNQSEHEVTLICSMRGKQNSGRQNSIWLSRCIFDQIIPREDLVRSRRLVLPRPFGHSDLSAARLPIPPRPHSGRLRDQGRRS